MKKIRFTVCLTKEHIKQVKELAKAVDRSVSSYIRSLIDEKNKKKEKE
ncbi:MAG: hypothetical protein HRT47_01540 [Candidatus Caenarcaniphilales bacterium]|nr:hypothetical protein [Candidatus Caenarcaniphilales bacterium]